MLQENIKLCPFCGGRALVIVWKEGEDRTVRVECCECKCSTPGIVFQLPCSPLGHVREIGWQPGLEDAKRIAVEAWNQCTGAPEPDQEQQRTSCTPGTGETPKPRRRPDLGAVL